MSSQRSNNLVLGGGFPPNNRTASPTASISSNDPPQARSPFGLQALGTAPLATSRSGNVSPNRDLNNLNPNSVRFMPKRTRELYESSGANGPNPWGGPPTSGNSTPLRENIPESPTGGFPEYMPLHAPTVDPFGSNAPTRRARAGTVPSRWSPGAAGIAGLPPVSAAPGTHRPANLAFKSPTLSVDSGPSSAALNRLRAGSMPQAPQFPIGTTTPLFAGPSNFSGWSRGSTRERGATLASIASVGSNGPDRDGSESEGMRTLDYLGLAETPQPTLATPVYLDHIDDTRGNRFRSYSVNQTDQYDEEGNPIDPETALLNQAQILQERIIATNAAINNHNLAVQALASQPIFLTRPRARTAGVLDTPGARMLGAYVNQQSSIPATLVSPELRVGGEHDYDDLSQAVAGMSIGRTSSRNNMAAEEQGLIEGPTCALWLGNIPTSTTTSTLMEMFKNYGLIISVRVLTHKNCGFVNFESTEAASAARREMNGKEIFPGSGPIRINYAKPPSQSNTPSNEGAFPSPSPDPTLREQPVVEDAKIMMITPPAAPKEIPLAEMSEKIKTMALKFAENARREEGDGVSRLHERLAQACAYNDYFPEIPPIRESNHTRQYDAPRLREIRKRIDNQSMPASEIENIAINMLPEIAELSSDYLGNTVVQKLFEFCCDSVRDMMLEQIAPHLAEIGVHKNGTWAAQKIIDVCKTPKQMTMIGDCLRPYTVSLFLDQYGNYVLQGCLKFGPPCNDFIFEAMLRRMWEISQGRYGARAMRACLEAYACGKDGQRMMAAAIALHSALLATNANGALLLTWYLDSCTFPHRRALLAPHIAEHLVLLCTHKVAYLTVLKVVNQKSEPDARDIILKAMFFEPEKKTLESILSDHNCGATLIFKVLTTPFFDDTVRPQIVDIVKSVLISIKAQPNQGYKRLMDEVGLSTRSSSSVRDSSGNGESRQRAANGRQAPAAGGPSATQAKGPQGANQPFYNGAKTSPGASQPGFSADMYGQPRSDTDSGVTPFPSFTPAANTAFVQQAALPTPQMPPAFYPGNQGMPPRGTPMGNYHAPIGAAGYNNYPPADQFRGGPPGINAAPGMSGNYPPGLNMGSSAAPQYGGYSSGMPPMGGFNPNQDGGRRGRN